MTTGDKTRTERGRVKTPTCSIQLCIRASFPNACLARFPCKACKDAGHRTSSRALAQKWHFANRSRSFRSKPQLEATSNAVQWNRPKPAPGEVWKAATALTQL